MKYPSKSKMITDVIIPLIIEGEEASVIILHWKPAKVASRGIMRKKYAFQIGLNLDVTDLSF